MREKTELHLIGYGRIKNRSQFMAWLEETGWRRKGDGYAYGGLHGGWFDDNWRDYFYDKQELFCRGEVRNIFNDAVSGYQSRTKLFFEFLDHLEEEGQKLGIYYDDGFACLVGYNGIYYVLPSEWVETTKFKDYGALTAAELRSIAGPSGKSLPVPAEGLSRDGVADKIAEAEEAYKSLQDRQKQIKEGTAAELAGLKAELDAILDKMAARKAELMEELERKKEELNEKKAQLNAQIFLLETQIYGIRCYTGEVIDFYNIRDGRPADKETPVIVYQKIRYLDEELAKAVSLYGFGAYEDDKEGLVRLLKSRDDLRDLFAPDERCVSLIRVSRTGKVKALSDRWANLLVDYETYHGKQMALLLRNGERLSIAWLDEDKIRLQSEDMFLVPAKQEYEAAEGSDEQLDAAARQNSATKEDIASRYFLLAILQGVVDSGKLMEFPEKFNVLSMVGGGSRYIIFSAADGRITDNRYGQFGDILQRVRKIPMKEGDMVLTGHCITRDDIYETGYDGRSHRYSRNNNDRGIGSSNRTYDASIPGREILPINRVMPHYSIKVSYEKIRMDLPQEGSTSSEWYEQDGPVIGTDTFRYSLSTETIEFWREHYGLKLTGKRFMQDVCEALEAADRLRGALFKDTDDGEAKELRLHWHKKEPDNKPIYKRRFTGAEIISVTNDYYIAANRSEHPDSTSNMQVMESEVIPLTYLCDSWVRYAIVTGHIDRFTVSGSTMTYADALPYLNKMAEYLSVQKEDAEVALTQAGLGGWMERTPDWDVKTTEWRIANSVRKMTPYQARRFAKTLQEE